MVFHYETLKSIKDTTDLASFKDLYLTKDEYGDYLDKTGRSGNIYAWEKNVEDDYKKGFYEMLDDALMDYKPSKSYKLQGKFREENKTSFDKLEKMESRKQRNTEYQKLKYASFFYVKNIVFNEGEFKSFRRGQQREKYSPKGIKQLDNSSIKIGYAGEEYSLRIDEIVKTENGWKIKSLD